MAPRTRGQDGKRAALERLDVFSALSDLELAELAQLSRLQSCAKGRALVKQGAQAEATFGVVSGRLRVALARADGSEATLTIVGPGELVGEVGLFQDGSRSAQVTALEDARVVVIPKDELLRFLEHSPTAGLALCRLLASRLRQLADHFEAVTALSVEQRLARKLVLLAERWGEGSPGGVGIGLRLSQQELAELADTSRQSVNKCLGSWRKAGVLASTTRRLVVRDMKALRRWAEGKEGRYFEVATAHSL